MAINGKTSAQEIIQKTHLHILSKSFPLLLFLPIEKEEQEEGAENAEAMLRA